MEKEISRFFPTMLLLLSGLFLALLAGLVFRPQLRVLYTRNPPAAGMVLTLVACFLGVYGALVLSRVEERHERMARAATLMEMTRESIATSGMEARLLARFLGEDGGETGGQENESRLADALPRELGDLLGNAAVLEQISPVSLKALMACQSGMEREIRSLAGTRGRDRRLRLRAYLREISFAQGVLAAEVEFQRGRISRGDLEEILQAWSLKKTAAQI